MLALLYLGVKNIHLGPTLPGFLSPNVAKALVETFGIAGIGTVEDDIQYSILNRTCSVNIGQLMLKYGGGVHKMVGTCQAPYDDADVIVSAIVKALND